ncbi:MAG: hypothetical protein A2Y62_07590 [Candidatus Fischerbacteria bacterium RBG_13_37_8]|uniref:Uncharacterized protein n=1 Tax=Candidatus Fischerbacteria bacterium RBG_13_37_8 TaxID=1817863 RepID=A0A1F5VI91_9BACT|nr:MAG: hypothetical protein A2Y62_07590 [Candidatus Fischerbacteria bacterium RBG_13_37_8]
MNLFSMKHKIERARHRKEEGNGWDAGMNFTTGFLMQMRCNYFSNQLMNYLSYKIWLPDLDRIRNFCLILWKSINS